MPKRSPDRTDTRVTSPFGAACIAVAVACSPGAPATESASNVPDFSTIPEAGWAPTTEPTAPAAGAAPATAPSNPIAGAGNEGSRRVTEGAPTGQLDPTSPGASTSNAGASGGDAPEAGGGPSSDGDPPGASAPTGGEPSETCALDVTVTTAPHGGRYTPRNVGALWITDSDGSFVKSLDVWGNRRLTHVEAWNAATEAAGVPQDRVDAVTGATEATHRTHNVSWDCTDNQGQLVPDGSYRVYFEVTEANGAGPNHFEAFEKGPAPATLQASAASFEGIVLSFQP